MPIRQSEYTRRPEKYWMGKKVSLDREVTTNGGVNYPAGTIGTITRKYGGFDILGAPCKCCGVKLHVKQVHPSVLSLIEDAPG